MSRPAAFVAACLALVATALPVVPAAAQGEDTPAGPNASGESATAPATVVVRFEDGVVRPAELGGYELDASTVPGSPYATVPVPPGEDPAAVAAALAARPDVAIAEPDRLVRAFESSGQVAEFERIGVQEAWTRADGDSEVVVAVVDSGVDMDHPDLQSRLVTGYDFVDDDSWPDDPHGHGTMVSGIIAARHGGGTPIDGVAGGGTRIMPMRVLDETGATESISDVADAVKMAADRGAGVVNLSLGADGTSDIMDDAVAYARANDVVVVAATGNWGSSPDHEGDTQTESMLTTPASAPGAIGVGATDNSGIWADFSIWGPMTDLVAPGVGIDSTYLDGTARGDGTSFSAPMVSGVAALLRDRHPGWTGLRVEVELLLTAEDGGPDGRDEKYGLGLVDAAVALGVAGIGSGGSFPAPTVNGIYDPVVGDFSGDGATDVLYYAPGTADDYLHLGARDGFRNRGEFPVNGTYEPFTVDLDGNGQDDILWYAPGPAEDYIWYAERGFHSVPTKASGDYEPFTLDLNGDGYEDIVWYAPGPAEDYIWYGTATGHKSFPTTARGEYEPFTGDFNDDGFDDIFWYAPGTADDYIWYGTPGGHKSFPTTVNGHYRPVAGDFDADGFGDVLWYAPGDAPDFQWLFRAGGHTSRATTINGTYVTLGGDFNGDRYDDVLFYGVGTRGDYLRFGSSTGLP